MPLFSPVLQARHLLSSRILGMTRGIEPPHLMIRSTAESANDARRPDPMMRGTLAKTMTGDKGQVSLCRPYPACLRQPGSLPERPVRGSAGIGSLDRVSETLAEARVRGHSDGCRCGQERAAKDVDAKGGYRAGGTRACELLEPAVAGRGTTAG